jgi:FlgD Ig-like domain/Rax2 C-terminal beta propeller domain
VVSHRWYAALPAALLVVASAAVCLAQNPDDAYWVDPFQGSGAPNEYTDAIVPYQGGFLMGGLFSSVCDLPVLRIALWDGAGWSPLSTGVGSDVMGLVHVIRLAPGAVYAAGMFDQIGPWAASNNPRWGNIARYDEPSQAWRPLGDGTDRAVRSIAIAPNGDLYCVGEFTAAGSVHAQGIARWDGMEWHDVGGSLGARARALAVLVSGNDVYVGGFFDSAGGTPISYIARWDGTQWNALGSGVDNLVTTIVEHDGKLYVGGAFTHAGGKPANRIAMWDGKNWSAFGDGLSGPDMSHVRSIEFDMDQFYVTGTWTHAGGEPAGFVATWYDGAWHSLGSGVNDQTKAALLHDGALWVTGNFTQAGGREMPYVAKWTKPGKNTVTFDRFHARREGSTVHLDWSFTAWGPWLGARVERNEPGEAPVALSRSESASSGDFVDDTALPDVAYDYTLVVERENGTEARSNPVRLAAIPDAAWLGQNQPNPFNPSTTIRFRVPAQMPVSLTVHDVAGRRIRTLAEGVQTTGEHSVLWDGRDDRGTSVAAGVYFYRLSAGSETLTRKMILLK